MPALLHFNRKRASTCIMYDCVFSVHVLTHFTMCSRKAVFTHAGERAPAVLAATAVHAHHTVTLIHRLDIYDNGQWSWMYVYFILSHNRMQLILHGCIFGWVVQYLYISALKCKAAGNILPFRVSMHELSPTDATVVALEPVRAQTSPVFDKCSAVKAHLYVDL